jgi:hypothetical protein
VNHDKSASGNLTAPLAFECYSPGQNLCFFFLRQPLRDLEFVEGRLIPMSYIVPVAEHGSTTFYKNFSCFGNWSEHEENYSASEIIGVIQGTPSYVSKSLTYAGLMTASASGHAQTQQ